MSSTLCLRFHISCFFVWPLLKFFKWTRWWIFTNILPKPYTLNWKLPQINFLQILIWNGEKMDVVIRRNWFCPFCKKREMNSKKWNPKHHSEFIFFRAMLKREKIWSKNRFEIDLSQNRFHPCLNQNTQKNKNTTKLPKPQLL